MADKHKSRLETKKSSQIHCSCTDSEEVLQVLKTLRQIVSSCRGPKGQIKMVQNSVGGHITMTSTSCRLLNAMSFCRPVVKLILKSVESHLQAFQDGGHFTVLLCLNLILESIELDVNRRILTELFEVMLNMCEEYLSYLSCSITSAIKHDIKMSDLKQMHAVVKSILSTKAMCALSHNGIDRLCNVLLQTFLGSLPDTDQGHQLISNQTRIIALAGKETTDSRIYQGLLIEWPEIPSYICKTLNIKRSKSKGNDIILVALVTVSMSGDSEELGNVHYEVDSSVDIDGAMLRIMEEFCEGLVRAEVGVVLCQRVVHPRLKLYLRQQGLLVVERCGLPLVNYVRDITGASPICTFHRVDQCDFGSLDTVTHEVLCDKSYLLLTSSKSTVTTLVLYSPQEEGLDELKVLCSTVLMTLRRLLHNSKVLSGAGCWQIHLASIIKSKVFGSHDKVEAIRIKYNCSKSTILSACKAFTRSLQRVATALSCDGESHMTGKCGHLWKLPKGENCDLDLMCACGMYNENTSNLQFINMNTESDNIKDSKVLDISNEGEKSDALLERDIVVDEYSMCISALKTAVLTANVVLSIGQYIQDNY